MRHSRLRAFASAIVAASLLVGTAAVPVAAWEARAGDAAPEAESVCAAAHADARALAATDRAHRLRASAPTASASPAQPVRTAPPARACDDDGVTGASSLARWCVAHSTSTSFV